MKCKDLLYYNLRGLFKQISSHMAAKDIKNKVGSFIWNNFFKFSFERNPYDKLVSFYFHIKPKNSFSEWINELTNKRKKQPLNYLLYTLNGKIIIDFLGKYENLESELKYILKKLNLPFQALPKEKTNYRDEKENYRKFYDEETRQIVEKVYRYELELKNYHF
jgi:predicted CopG family antitoxin